MKTIKIIALILIPLATIAYALMPKLIKCGVTRVEITCISGQVQTQMIGFGTAKQFGKSIHEQDLIDFISKRDFKLQLPHYEDYNRSLSQFEIKVIHAIDLLGHINSKASVKQLTRLCTDQNYSIRGAAVYAIKKLNAKEALPELIYLLQNKVPCNGMLIPAIGTLGNKSCIEPLINVMAIGAGRETEDALDAIEIITGKDMTELRESLKTDSFDEFHMKIINWWDAYQNSPDSNKAP